MNNIWFLECLYLYGVYIDILLQQLTAAMTILSGIHEIYIIINIRRMAETK